MDKVKRIVRAKTVKSDQEEIPTNPTKRIDMTPVLTVLLIVAAFFVGMLYSKVQYLEKGNAKVTAAAAVPTTGPAQGQAAAPTMAAHVNVGNGHFPLRGDPNAKVTIVEFADFRCPFCEQTFSQVEPQLQKEYIDTGKVKMAFRHYAFLGPASTVAANAAECANDQGKFWDMHDYLYKNQPPETDTSLYTVDKLTDVAGQLGMDTAAFKDCLTNNKFSKNVDSDIAAGQKAGVSATPTFFINGTPIVGAESYAAFKSIIDAALQKS